MEEMFNEMIEESLNWLYRVIARSNIYEATYQKGLAILKDYYKDKVKVEVLGTRSTLITIEEADFERLYIGTYPSYTRLGYMIDFSLYNSPNIELVRRRVRERLAIFEGLELISDSDNFGVDDNGEYIDFIKADFLGSKYIRQGTRSVLAPLMKEGGSMTNRYKNHFAWVRGYEDGKDLSIDENLYKLLEMNNTPHTKCIGCGVEVFGMQLCPLCVHKYGVCADCGKNVLKKEGKWLGNRFLCSECAIKPKCKGCGASIEEGNSLCERCEGVRGVLNYHSEIGRQDESEGSRFKIGIEVEKEDFETKLNLNCRAILRETGWVIERDSSLGDDGFEAISPIYPLNIGKVRDKIRPLNDLINARTTDRCGGHIHVSDTERTPFEILSDIRGYLPLLYSLYPNRASNAYCEAKEIDGYLDTGHRQALNITRNTLEFRIFPAVKNVNQLLFRIKIVKYLLENPQKDISKVGELLLNERSTLYKILNERISKTRLKEKAKIFIDYANYLERDGLAIRGTKVERVLDISKMKEEKTKAFEKRVDDISKSIKIENSRYYEGEKIMLPFETYGYFANLIKE